MTPRKPARSRATAPGQGPRDPALELARAAVPAHLHASGRTAARDRTGSPHPLTAHLLRKHAATLRAGAPGDADVLFDAEDQGGKAALVVQVRGGRVRRVLTRA